MFVVQEARLGVPVSIAQVRLSNLIRGSRLVEASEDAYDEWVTGLVRVGVPGVSRLVRARFLELATRGEAVVLRLRWEATGPGEGLFPALDADITLTPDGDQATLLRMDGAYRPPLGAVGTVLDRMLLHRVAASTTRSFVIQVAEAIVSPQPAAESVQAARQWELLTAAAPDTDEG